MLKHVEVTNTMEPTNPRVTVDFEEKDLSDALRSIDRNAELKAIDALDDVKKSITTIANTIDVSKFEKIFLIKGGVFVVLLNNLNHAENGKYLRIIITSDNTDYLGVHSTYCIIT